MRIGLKRRTIGSRNGVALIIVMLMVLAMAGIAGIFAYSMKVEIKLATNTSSSGELAWVGLSGVEVAKWILVEEQRVVGSQQCNSLKQFWAGGPGDSEGGEDPFEGISLKHIQIDEASYVALEIIDQERKLNINQADPLLLEAALNTAGAGSADANAIHAALLDWRDKDDLVSVGGGAESDYYEKLDPPYRAKNGPVDDIGELLKVRGVSSELYWGANHQESRKGSQFEGVETAQNTGLADLFCALSNGQVNINTAPLAVLQVAFRGDSTMAKQVVQVRAGPDGIEGTTDDEPARNPGEVARLLGPAIGGGAQGRFTTISSVFEVRIEAHYGRSVRRYSAIIQRRGGRDFQTLAFREI
jgi:general secretion pathway protein K